MQLKINASSFEDNSSLFGKCGSIMNYKNYFYFCVQFWSLKKVWMKPKRTEFQLM